MPAIGAAVSRHPVHLDLDSLSRMIRLGELLSALSRRPEYVAAISPGLPPIARHAPGHESVLMGYDFHLTEEGPQLIEVNTNAGGLLPAWLAYARHHRLPAALPTMQRACLLGMFAAEWQGYRGACQLPGRPEHILILDDNPAGQYLYPEMRWFQRLLQEWGADCHIADPQELEADGHGVQWRGRRVDLIYNRHTDFYLESAPLAGIAAAYLAGSVCLTPNPRAYGLLADKRRLAQWSDPLFRRQLELEPSEEALLAEGLPDCRLMTEWDPAALWQQRQDYVFKPLNQFGGKGVLLGKSVSHTRFDQLPATATLVQRVVPPSLTPVPGEEPMKTDFRLFWYRNRVLALAARLYRGQVTNLRTVGGGFAPVVLAPPG